MAVEEVLEALFAVMDKLDSSCRRMMIERK